MDHRLKMKRSKIPQYKLNCERLKHIRTQRLNMDQQEVSDILGVSKFTYLNWERGRNLPNATYFLKLVQLFGNEIYEEVPPEEAEARKEESE